MIFLDIVDDDAPYELMRETMNGSPEADHAYGPGTWENE